ncbi:MAG TPA: ATPase [Ruminiclostridium sp.]|nr:ATP-binding protein [Clostridiaceae bacterium]HAA25698.1 ATPase [Ruminiclostridium sp.]
MMYIKRHVEDTIKKVSEMYPAVIVTGPRQVGKTTVLKKLYGNLRYVTLDNPETLEYARNEGGLFFKTFIPPVVLDEVQYAPELFPYIKIIADETKQKKLFFMTGSQTFHLMKNVSESLAGRIGIIQILGLSLREIKGRKFNLPFLPTGGYLEQSEKDAEELSQEEIWSIIQRGSMPRLYHADVDDNFWRQFYSDYVKTYIERDVRALTQVGDEIAFLQFMRLLAASTGQLLNYSRIANEIGKSVGTVKNWVSILRTSGVIYLLQPYYHNFNKRIVKTPKVYFLDTGLASYLTGWYTSEQLQFGAMSGCMFETFVVSEILKSYYNKGYDDFGFSFYRDKDMNEIDLLIENNGVLYPIEIKKTGSPNKQDIKAFSKLEKEDKKILGEGGVICMADSIRYLTTKDRVIPFKNL